MGTKIHFQPLIQDNVPKKFTDLKKVKFWDKGSVRVSWNRQDKKKRRLSSCW